MWKFCYKKRECFSRSYKSRGCLPNFEKWSFLWDEVWSIHFVSSLENRILEIEKWLYPLRHSSSCRVGGDWYRSTSVSSSANFTFIRLSIFFRGVRTARRYYRGITAEWRAALPCRQNKTTLFILPEICFCLRRSPVSSFSPPDGSPADFRILFHFVFLSSRSPLFASKLIVLVPWLLIQYHFAVFLVLDLFIRV